jgi:hypothetical protein
MATPSKRHFTLETLGKAESFETMRTIYGVEAINTPILATHKFGNDFATGIRITTKLKFTHLKNLPLSTVKNQELIRCSNL